MLIEVTTRGARHRIPLRWLADVGRSAMRATRCPRQSRIEIALVGDAIIASLNWRFLRHRGATDVITFPAGARSKDGVLGEIVISVDQARRQARLYGHSVRREVALLLVHGVLHLRGHDDRTPRSAARMHKRTEVILKRILVRRR